jgi:hypothetical protein
VVETRREGEERMNEEQPDCQNKLRHRKMNHRGQREVRASLPNKSQVPNTNYIANE